MARTWKETSVERSAAAPGRLRRVETPDGRVAYRSPLLEAAGVPHAFTTRCAGTTGALDLSDPGSDECARIGAVAGLRAPLVRLRQVHGRRVHVALRVPSSPPEADGLVTATPGLLLAVRVADCVPVLLASSDGRRVAAVHAGWRGIVAGVLDAALDALRDGRRAALLAAVGPSIGAERFEVGEEVAEAFERAALGAAVVRPRAGRPRVDLRGAVRAALERRGVSRIDESDRCTYDDAAEFHSYRRDVTHAGGLLGGHQGALIGIAR